jgi:hypothetical protein
MRRLALRTVADIARTDGPSLSDANATMHSRSVMAVERFGIDVDHDEVAGGLDERMMTSNGPITWIIL